MTIIPNNTDLLSMSRMDRKELRQELLDCVRKIESMDLELAESGDDDLDDPIPFHRTPEGYAVFGFVINREEDGYWKLSQVCDEFGCPFPAPQFRGNFRYLETAKAWARRHIRHWDENMRKNVVTSAACENGGLSFIESQSHSNTAVHN